MKIVIRKSLVHKYYKREGVKGSYKYYYTKEEYDREHKTKNDKINFIKVPEKDDSGYYLKNDSRETAEGIKEILGGGIYQAMTGTCYLNYVFDKKTFKIRISDHIQSKDRSDHSVDYFINLTDYFNPKSIKDKLNNEVLKQKEIEIEKIKSREDAENRNTQLDKDVKFIENKYPNYGYFNITRTYMSLDEFKNKFPEAKHIKQVKLDRNAFEYNYIKPKNGHEKPMNTNSNYIKEIINEKI